MVELTIALHYVFDTPDDRLVWDVGHQAYPHKILTERRELMGTLRQKNGLAAFPRRAESEYDTFGVGHSSTSISAALGMAIAARLQGKERKSVAVIGDGALTAGMAFEALNHASEVDADMLVILNDNDMSISHNVGGLSNYLAKILSSRTYSSMREGSKKVLSRLPGAWEIARRTEEYAKGMLVPGTLFEELGWNYIGPIDGHDLPTLVATLRNMRDMKGPQFLHVVTKKGKGFAPAELDPIGYHAITKLEAPGSAPKKTGGPKYSSVFGQWLCDMAAQDARLLGITPAMKEGSDLVAFSERYPERYFDVAIAEQHAVTLAAGMACEGMKPVVAIYSTFLQRAYDQLIHDVAVQHLDVLFAIDRAGLVGEDGPTHQPIEQLASLRLTPNLDTWRPADAVESAVAWKHAIERADGPSALIFSRQNLPHQARDVAQVADIARGGYVLKDCEGEPELILIATGSEVGLAVQAYDKLSEQGRKVRVVSMPCTSVYEQQDESYKQSVLPVEVGARIAIEAAHADYWYKYVGLDGRIIGMTSFGESAPAPALFEHFGFTLDNVLAVAEELLED